MKNKKIVIAFLLMMAILVAFMGKAYAADSFKINFQRDSSDRVPKGSTFKLTMKLSKVNNEKGLTIIKGTLSFKDDILEITTNSSKKENITPQNGWEVSYNAENGNIVFENDNYIKNDSDICEIEFKVKDKTSANTAQIKFDNIEGASPDMSDVIKISGVTTTVTIGSSETPSSSTQPSQEPPASNPANPSTSSGTSSKPGASNLPGTTDENKTQPPSQPAGNTTRSEQDIPKSGSEDYIIPLIIAIAALGLISYVNYKKID